MVSLHKVDEQLKQIGVNFQFWGRRELRELSKIMTDTEEIKQCVNGHYQGGFAMLVATNQRLLLIDRKPMFLTVEAIWYDKIGQVDFNHRLMNASICVSTPNKDLGFISWNSPKLREIMLYTQEKMIEAKTYGNPAMQQPQGYQQQPNYRYSGRPQEMASMNVPQWRETNQNQPQLNQQPEPEPQQTVIPENTADVNADLSYGISRTRLPYSRRRYFGNRLTSGA